MTREPTLEDYTLSLRRSRRTIIVLALVGLVLGGLLGALRSSDQAVVDVSVIDEVELASTLSTTVLTPDQVAGELSVIFTDSGGARVLVGTHTVRSEVKGSRNNVGDETLAAVSAYVDGRRDTRLADLAKSSDFHNGQVDELDQAIEELQRQINDVAEAGGDTVSLQTELVVALNSRVNEQLLAERYDTLSTVSNAQLGDPYLVRVDHTSSAVLFAIVGAFLGGLIGVIVALVPSRRSRKVRRLADVLDLVDGVPVTQVVVRGGDLDTALVHLDRAAVRIGSRPNMLVLGDIWTNPSDCVVHLAALQGPPIFTATTDWSKQLDDSADVIVVVDSGHVATVSAQRVFEILATLGVRTVGILLVEVPPAEELWARDASSVEVGS